MKTTLALLFALAPFCIALSHAGDSRENSTPQQILIAIADGDWPPLEMKVDGKPAGFHIELVDQVARQLGIKITYKSYPWKRAIEMVRSGQADAITYMSYTKEREKFGIFLKDNILSRSNIGLFTQKENADKIQFSGDLHELEPYTIGTLKGYAYNDAFDDAEYLSKDESSSHEKLLVMKIIHGRLPLAIGNIDDIRYNAKKMGVLDQLAFLEPHVQDGQANYIVFKRSNDNGLAELFAAQMRAFKQTDKYQSLLRKFAISPL